MIVVTACQTGSGRMRPASSGTTMVSPGLMPVLPRENQWAPAVTMLRWHHSVDAVSIGLARDATRGRGM